MIIVTANSITSYALCLFRLQKLKILHSSVGFILTEQLRDSASRYSFQTFYQYPSTVPITMLISVFHNSSVLLRVCIQKFPDWVDNEIKITTTSTGWEARKMVTAAKLTRLTYKIAIQLQLVAENCTICSSRSRRPVLKLLDTPRMSVIMQPVTTLMKGISADSGNEYAIATGLCKRISTVCFLFYLLFLSNITS
jgi:hypothetical protein